MTKLKKPSTDALILFTKNSNNHEVTNGDYISYFKLNLLLTFHADLYFRLEWLSTATYAETFFLIFCQGNEPILNLKICAFILVLLKNRTHLFIVCPFLTKGIITENTSRKD